MKSFRFNYDCDELPINKNKKYLSKTLTKLKKELATAKDQMDEDFKNPEFNRYWKLFDPFRQEKRMVAQMGNTVNVSNAWLKCYEILNYYEILPEQLRDNEYVHFDNAAFPGSFIISTHHLISTTKQWHDKYKWYGSSLYTPNRSNRMPLEDMYSLYKNYTNNWLMDEKNDGDVLSYNNQRDFADKIGGEVDLYTSDLGFDVSNDYNNQELLQLPANIGQILSGVLTLKENGCFITKQYMTFEMTTVSVMFALSQMFDEFYLCKPFTSREANSETYLVGKGFKGNITFSHPYVKALFDRMENPERLEVPLFDAKNYPKQYLQDVFTASKEIFGKQIIKINHDLSAARLCLQEQDTNHISVQNFNKKIQPLIEKWYLDNVIYPIPSFLRLRMRNAFKKRR